MTTPIPTTPSNLIAVTAAILLFALTIYLLIVGQAIFVPLVLAIFIAYLIVALSRRLQRIKIGSRHLPSGLALTAAVVLLLAGLGVLVELVADNVGQVVAAAPLYQSRLETLLLDINGMAAGYLKKDTPITATSVLEQIDLRLMIGRLAGAFQSIAGSTFQIFIYVAFLLLEVRTFDHKMAEMFPGSGREKAVRAALVQIGGKIETYVWIKTAMSLLTGIMSYAVLATIGIDFAAFWALLLFILNYIPYIGSIIGVVFPTVLSLLQFGSIPAMLAVFGTLTAVQLFIGNVVEPRMTGKSLNLSPIVMMVGLSVWGTMWGITGMILSVPIMVIAMIVLSQFPRTRPLAVLMSESGDIR